jgi:hypothetical protein
MKDKKKADPQASPNTVKHHFASNGSTATGAGACFLDMRRTDSERLRIVVSEYRGRTLIDLRVWYSTESGEFRPGRAGVSLRPDQVAEVVQGLLLGARSIDPREVA